MYEFPETTQVRDPFPEALVFVEVSDEDLESAAGKGILVSGSCTSTCCTCR